MKSAKAAGVLWDRFLVRFHQPYQVDGYGTCCAAHLRRTHWPCKTIEKVLARYDRRHGHGPR